MAELDARRAEVLSNAAKTIQRRTRTHIARKQFIALRKATIHVQSRWRGKPVAITCQYMSSIISLMSFPFMKMLRIVGGGVPH